MICLLKLSVLVAAVVSSVGWVEALQLNTRVRGVDHPPITVVPGDPFVDLAGDSHERLVCSHEPCLPPGSSVTCAIDKAKDWYCSVSPALPRHELVPHVMCEEWAEDDHEYVVMDHCMVQYTLKTKGAPTPAADMRPRAPEPHAPRSSVMPTDVDHDMVAEFFIFLSVAVVVVCVMGVLWNRWNTSSHSYGSAPVPPSGKSVPIPPIGKSDVAFAPRPAPEQHPYCFACTGAPFLVHPSRAKLDKLINDYGVRSTDAVVRDMYNLYNEEYRGISGMEWSRDSILEHLTTHRKPTDSCGSSCPSAPSPMNCEASNSCSVSKATFSSFATPASPPPEDPPSYNASTQPSTRRTMRVDSTPVRRSARLAGRHDQETQRIRYVATDAARAEPPSPVDHDDPTPPLKKFLSAFDKPSKVETKPAKGTKATFSTFESSSAPSPMTEPAKATFGAQSLGEADAPVSTPSPVEAKPVKATFSAFAASKESESPSEEPGRSVFPLPAIPTPVPGPVEESVKSTFSTFSATKKPSPEPTPSAPVSEPVKASSSTFARRKKAVP